MIIYVDDGTTVTTYPVKTKVAKAVMTLLELDEELVWSETHPGYCVEIVDKEGYNATKKQESILDKIRAEITAIAINGQVDEHTAFIRTGEQVKQVALDIIDKYRAENF